MLARPLTALTNIEEGQKFRLGQTLEVKGIAWDGGYGIQLVQVSTDEGTTWRPAELSQDLGRFAWRQWSYRFKPDAKGKHTIMAKATNRIGNTQTFEPILNPAGYHQRGPENRHRRRMKEAVMKILALFMSLFSAAAFADEGTIQLKDGLGKDLVMGNCVMCHSLDYVPMNSVFLDRKGWEASVNKMIKVMGAPIKSEDIPQIVDYLTKYYGK